MRLLLADLFSASSKKEQLISLLTSLSSDEAHFIAITEIGLLYYIHDVSTFDALCKTLSTDDLRIKLLQHEMENDKSLLRYMAQKTGFLLAILKAFSRVEDQFRLLELLDDAFKKKHFAEILSALSNDVAQNKFIMQTHEHNNWCNNTLPQVDLLQRILLVLPDDNERINFINNSSLLAKAYKPAVKDNDSYSAILLEHIASPQSIVLFFEPRPLDCFANARND